MERVVALFCPRTEGLGHERSGGFRNESRAAANRQLGIRDNGGLSKHCKGLIISRKGTQEVNMDC